jgi:chromosome segregation ATPase
MRASRARDDVQFAEEKLDKTLTTFLDTISTAEARQGTEGFDLSACLEDAALQRVAAQRALKDVTSAIRQLGEKEADLRAQARSRLSRRQASMEDARLRLAKLERRTLGMLDSVWSLGSAPQARLSYREKNGDTLIDETELAAQDITRELQRINLDLEEQNEIGDGVLRTMQATSERLSAATDQANLVTEELDLAKAQLALIRQKILSSKVCMFCIAFVLLLIAVIIVLSVAMPDSMFAENVPDEVRPPDPRGDAGSGRQR